MAQSDEEFPRRGWEVVGVHLLRHDYRFSLRIIEYPNILEFGISTMFPFVDPPFVTFPFAIVLSISLPLRLIPLPLVFLSPILSLLCRVNSDKS